MKTLIASAVITLVFAEAARAQTDGVERLSITVQGATVSSPGGEEERVGGGANPNEPGKTVRHGFSLRTDRCTWGASRVVEPDADLGWAVEITPVRVLSDAVTFHLAWARTRDEGKASTQPKSDMELTLRPGESIPLDAVYRPCPNQPRAIGASLRVTVVRYPDPDYDRRLIALDLWLVEKLADGTERSQPLSLRGLYHRPIPFYFDSITEAAMVLDIFGEVTAAPGDRASDVKIITRSRIFDPNQPPGRPFPRETTATIRITPNEVVSVQLPQVADSSAFSSRALSLRVRMRQLR
jgi:hypothetical protein